MIKIGGMVVEASAGGGVLVMGGGGLFIDSSFATSIRAARVLFFALSIGRAPPLHKRKS